MAIDLSAVQPGPCMVLVEATSGTQPVGFTADACGFFTMASVNPVQPDLQYQRIKPHLSTFQQTKDIPTFKLVRVRLRSPIMAGSAANSPPRFAGLWQCAGMYQSIIAGTPGSVQWVQATPQQIVSSSFAFEAPGRSGSIVHEVNGLVGNVTTVGSPREGFYFDFEGIGRYQHPQEGTLTSLYTGAWSAGTNNANKFILSGTERISINNGGSDYFGVVKRAEWTTGATPSPITDINSGATYGIYSIEQPEFEPTLTIDFGFDTDPAANVSLLDLYEDEDDGTLHTVTYTYTDLGGRTLTYTFTGAQVRTVSYAEDEKIRVTRVVYNLTGAPFQIDQN